MSSLKNITADGITSLDFDITVAEDFYVRTRICQSAHGGKVYYFVRSGDTAESGESRCTAEKFAKAAAGTAAILRESAPDGIPAQTACKLVLNDGACIENSLPAETVKAIADTLAGLSDELRLLDGFKRHVL